MANNFIKAKRHVLTNDGSYKPLSYWTDADSVTLANGNTAEDEITALKTVATTAANGQMSSAMVAKLNTIDTSANNYTHPTYTSSASGLKKITVDGTGHVSATAAVAKTDITGLGIPAQDTTYATATTAANGLMTSAMVTKLNGIADNAQVNTITGVKGASESSYRTGQVSLSAANVGAIASTEKGAASGVAPLNASGIIDSTYLPSYVDDVLEYASRDTFPATGESGKIYVDTSAEENNTYRWSGSTYILIAKNTNTTYSISKSDSTVTLTGSDGSTSTFVDADTTYASATTASNGLMTSTDKAKLDSVAASANNYIHPTYTSSASGLKKITVDGTGHVSATAAVAKTDITGLGIPAQDTTYAAFTSAAAGLVPVAASGTTNYTTSGYVLTGAGWKAGTKYNTDTTYAVASASANGLMSSGDFSKLDSVAASANNYTHPTYTSSASGLKKITVDGTGHVSATAAVAKTDITGLGIPAQDTTYAAFTGATSAADGTTGLVPAPTTAVRTKFLRADGTWATPTNGYVTEADEKLTIYT